MSDIKFAEGISIRKHTFSNGGFILKVGINMANFMRKTQQMKGATSILILKSPKMVIGTLYLIHTTANQNKKISPIQMRI